MPTARRSQLARAVVLATVAGLSLGACRKKPAPAPTPVETPTTTTQPRVNQDSIDAENRRRAEEEERRRREAAALESARATLNAPVYFDYDAADLRDDARAVLEAKLPILTANAGLRIRIAGHTDSRGSDEYNLALGQRRASAVKDWLSGRGIAADRMEIVSFGEERGSCADEEEGCWSRNRRAEFEVTAGGDRITAPTGGQ
ncbi:OmpA family protein [Roseisolibacter sp. H3M3-2]|uniref:OmpA family protein n=1 Tax=Roseisolibacter sp. H3M3-2 TaxID=3031323 RepID=UPI0023DCB98F|nr:OmpA family protein [Roseisolibacter sp. H3M3-2]MDF1505952.1 OmpA family protein [Roseisolibacter sp. H3M3-2]